MTSTPYYYVTQAELEAYLGVTLTPTGLAQFNLMLPGIMGVVDQYCNRTWDFANPVVENFDALTNIGAGVQANYSFYVKYPMISATAASPTYPLAGGVISVVIGTTSVDMNYVVSYGTHIKLAAAFPSVILANPLGFKMVQVTYNSDSSKNVPQPVKLAMIQWMARLIQTSPDAGKEATQVQVGTVNATFAKDTAPGIPDFVKLVLDNYRLVALDHF